MVFGKSRTTRRREWFDRNAFSAELQPHQIAAARSPRTPIRVLVEQHESTASDEPAPSSGNFKDLESLLEQFAHAPIFELGKPLPKEHYLPRPKAGSCPAAHMRALADEERT